ncbi:hypothetical protein Nm8I071_22710 [Nonomuraea sp. TT08I-71]|nr:hypothetical protein Nm8I071_22710 [Nonomuraea sp. TT08I-71]
MTTGSEFTATITGEPGSACAAVGADNNTTTNPVKATRRAAWERVRARRRAEMRDMTLSPPAPPTAAAGF